MVWLGLSLQSLVWAPQVCSGMWFEAHDEEGSDHVHCDWVQPRRFREAREEEEEEEEEEVVLSVDHDHHVSLSSFRPLIKHL